MAVRSVISYDDITLPPAASSIQLPAFKKRKWNNNHKPTSTVQHWDDPSPTIRGGPSNRRSQSEDKEVVFNDDEAEREDEESRELTHEEIWDDSALVDAWNAAMEEYEAYNGPDKGWKKEPVHKSPLWYNVPPKKPSKPRKDSTTPITFNEASVSVEEADSKPINFETFVPTHNPSISDDPALEPPRTSYIPTQGSVVGFEAGTMINQDEAFSRALSAMYWGGYWTAMYHCQRQLSGNVTASTATAGGNDQTDVDEDEDMVYEEEEEEEEEGFVSTQR